MNGSKTSPVISFLNDLNERRIAAETDANLAADPTIKMRRLQAAKDDGREKCLSYIFGQVCANAVPAPGEVPYNPAPTPDIDKVVGNFISSRTGGQGATFYVKEAIKRKSECAKNLLESVDKILSEMYLEKEMNPETITDADLKFEMTPAVTEKLGKVIQDNNLDALADVIKTNVKADAVDEVIAAKKEKDDRMALEEELRNDPSITTPEQIQEAVDARFNPRDLMFYQPRLLEGIMIKHFNEAAAKESAVTESGGQIRVVNGAMNYRGWSSLSRVNDMFVDIENDISKYSERMRRFLDDENRDIRRRYYWDIMPIDINKITQKFSALISSGKLSPNQQFEVIDSDQYMKDLETMGSSLREALTNGTEIVAIPIRASKIIPASAVVGELNKNIAAIKLDKTYAPQIERFVTSANQIAMKYGRTSSGLSNTFKTATIAALMEIELASVYIVNASNMIDKIRDILQEAEMSQPMTEAFVGALYEYTMFNVAKAMRLEHFGLPEIGEIALSYAQGKV